MFPYLTLSFLNRIVTHLHILKHFFFKFASGYVYEDSCMLVFLLVKRKVTVDMLTYLEIYDLAIAKDW